MGLQDLSRRGLTRAGTHFQAWNCVPARVYARPKILFTTCFDHGFPDLVARPSAFNASQIC